jgi:hypothetical protein
LLVWEHCEYHGAMIKGTHAEHWPRADTGPMKEFLRKERRHTPHLF